MHASSQVEWHIPVSKNQLSSAISIRVHGSSPRAVALHEYCTLDLRLKNPRTCRIRTRTMQMNAGNLRGTTPEGNVFHICI